MLEAIDGNRLVNAQLGFLGPMAKLHGFGRLIRFAITSTQRFVGQAAF